VWGHVRGLWSQAAQQTAKGPTCSNNNKKFPTFVFSSAVALSSHTKTALSGALAAMPWETGEYDHPLLPHALLGPPLSKERSEWIGLATLPGATEQVSFLTPLRPGEHTAPLGGSDPRHLRVKVFQAESKASMSLYRVSPGTDTSQGRVHAERLRSASVCSWHNQHRVPDTTQHGVWSS
jgi:hypothetical protein